MKSNYKSIGSYIKEVDIRNVNLEPLTLWGVSIDKKFIKSVSNIIGTDLSKYKVVSKNQFVCSLMQVSRDERIPIDKWSMEESIIVSPAYKVFEVCSDELLPEYLNLWFKRSEFDREASFYGVGGVRGSLEWNDFCELSLPVPSIMEQKKIIEAYNVIDRRIEIKRKINDNLEAQAQTIYRNTFEKSCNVTDGIVADLAKEIVCGKTPKTSNSSNFLGDIPFITIPDMHNSVFAHKTERYLSNTAASCAVPPNSVCVSCIASAGLVCLTDRKSQTNQQINTIVCKSSISHYFVYHKMLELSDHIKHIGSCGSTTCNLSKSGLSNIAIQIPDTALIKKFHLIVTPIFSSIRVNEEEIIALDKMKKLVLGHLTT